MTIMKLTRPVETKLVNKFWVNNEIASPCKEQLLEARGTISNYLRDKNFTVFVNQHRACEDELVFNACGANQKPFGTEIVSKSGESPFLRRVYIAIENLAKLRR